MYLDDTVDFIEEMPANIVDKILKNTSSDKRKLIKSNAKISRKFCWKCYDCRIIYLLKITIQLNKL